MPSFASLVLLGAKEMPGFVPCSIPTSSDEKRGNKQARKCLGPISTDALVNLSRSQLLAVMDNHSSCLSRAS